MHDTSMEKLRGKITDGLGAAMVNALCREDILDVFGTCPDCGQRLDRPAEPIATLGRFPLWCATCEHSRPAKPGPVSETGTGTRGLCFGGTSPDPNPITY